MIETSHDFDFPFLDALLCTIEILAGHSTDLTDHLRRYQAAKTHVGDLLPFGQELLCGLHLIERSRRRVLAVWVMATTVREEILCFGVEFLGLLILIKSELGVSLLLIAVILVVGIILSGRFGTPIVPSGVVNIEVLSGSVGGGFVGT